VIVAALGCRPDEASVRKWRDEQRAADLAGVVVGSADDALRASAAMALVGMDPVRGRVVGPGVLVELALPQLSVDSRQRLLAKLVPLMIAELRRDPPRADRGKPTPADPSMPTKDAAYMMLAYEHWGSGNPALIADSALRQQLEQALIEWAMADFERRLDDGSQAYGMEPLLRIIGPRSVAGIPKLMDRDAKRLTTMAELVGRIGDDATREQAGQRLVEASQYVASEEWRAKNKPELEEANRRAGLAPAGAQLDAQLAAFQEETLARLSAALRQVRGKTTVDEAGAAGQISQPAAAADPAGSVAVSGGAVANASEVVARMRARFRRCYAEGRKTNPDMAGTITLVAKIGPDGEVTSVGGGTAGALSPIAGCLKAVVQGAAFDPPAGGSAVITIPLTFVSQK
jgi:hypothetical protein